MTVSSTAEWRDPRGNVIAAVVSAPEILFLYWNALRGTAALSHIGGVALHGDGNAALIAIGLARAALEFPMIQGDLPRAIRGGAANSGDILPRDVLP